MVFVFGAIQIPRDTHLYGFYCSKPWNFHDENRTNVGLVILLIAEKLFKQQI